MKKHPLVHAVLALAYIALVASTMNYLGSHNVIPEKSIIAPITFLSLLTLSVGVMGYLFAAQPLLMYLDGDKRGGVNFLLQTLGYFAAITVILLVVLLSGIIK